MYLVIYICHRACRTHKNTSQNNFVPFHWADNNNNNIFQEIFIFYCCSRCKIDFFDPNILSYLLKSRIEITFVTNFLCFSLSFSVNPNCYSPKSEQNRFFTAWLLLSHISDFVINNGFAIFTANYFHTSTDVQIKHEPLSKRGFTVLIFR